MIVYRDFNCTEHDDFVLNVQPRLSNTNEAVPLIIKGEVVGWKIQTRYE